MTQCLHSVADMRAAVAAWRKAGERVAFVPTMGSLHAGHLSLVEAARERAERVVVSIFVNPLQFAAGEDFAAYPRTLEADVAQLKPLGVDVVFAPSEEDLYPHGRAQLTQVAVPELSAQLCGEFRAGHFEGVTTVVSILLHIVQPDSAVFGQKDYQQLAIIRRMVRDLHMPVEILGVCTRREPSGLALSSRNAFLQPDQRTQAACLYAQLQSVGDALKAGRRDYPQLQDRAMAALSEMGVQPQFFEIRRPDLSVPDAAAQHFVILVAAKLGATRLIDNIEVDASRP